LDTDIDELEKILEEGAKANPGTPPILSLFTEFPSNPLLRSANLPRLRQLADKYGFIIVIDETIGTFVNVKVIQYADIVVSSLTKVFSGASNVMGGRFVNNPNYSFPFSSMGLTRVTFSLILNPQSPHYNTLKTKLTSTYEDVFFDEDAIYMERNSRDFKQRIHLINSNAEAACDFLRSRSVSGGYSNANVAIKEVWYPKYITSEHYDHCRIKSSTSEDGKAGGYGGLFSLTFTSKAASQAFFDNLPCYKGPSLGTNFTLACPFTILAHFTELEWAARYGVEEGLVRVSVGMEEREGLLKGLESALVAAEAAGGAGSA
jgi:cystathionine gamma-synthase